MCVVDATKLSCEKGIIMVHINARSLFHKIEDIFSNFHYCNIIVITETWLTCNIPTNAISVEGFLTIRQDRYENSNKKGGGICIYVKSDFTYERHNSVCTSTPDCETLGIKLKIRKIKAFHIIGTYRPPTGNMAKYVERLIDTLEGIDLTR